MRKAWDIESGFYIHEHICACTIIHTENMNSCGHVDSYSYTGGRKEGGKIDR